MCCAGQPVVVGYDSGAEELRTRQEWCSKLGLGHGNCEEECVTPGDFYAEVLAVVIGWEL